MSERTPSANLAASDWEVADLSSSTAPVARVRGLPAQVNTFVVLGEMSALHAGTRHVVDLGALTTLKRKATWWAANAMLSVQPLNCQYGTPEPVSISSECWAKSNKNLTSLVARLASGAVAFPCSIPQTRPARVHVGSVAWPPERFSSEQVRKLFRAEA